MAMRLKFDSKKYTTVYKFHQIHKALRLIIEVGETHNLGQYIFRDVA
jgi:hypothetical protein